MAEKKLYLVTHPIKDKKEVKKEALMNKWLIVDAKHIETIDPMKIAKVDGTLWEDGKPKRKTRRKTAKKEDTQSQEDHQEHQEDSDITIDVENQE